MMKHWAGREESCATELSSYGHPVELGEVVALIFEFGQYIFLLVRSSDLMYHFFFFF